MVICLFPYGHHFPMINQDNDAASTLQNALPGAFMVFDFNYRISTS